MPAQAEVSGLPFDGKVEGCCFPLVSRRSKNYGERGCQCPGNAFFVIVVSLNMFSTYLVFLSLKY